jgi:hypothetical protein
MIRSSISSIAAFACLLAGWRTAARADEPASTPNYLIYPVKTDLQKELVPASADVFVLLNTTDALADNKIVPSALRLPDLRKELLPHKKANAKLHFTLFFKRSDADRKQSENFVRHALIGFGEEIGFSKVSAYGYYPATDMTWNDLTGSFTGKGRQSEGDEPASKNELVQAYLVRTHFSRFLTSDADCAVIVDSSLQMNDGFIPPKVWETTTELLSKIKLEQRNRISFHVGHLSDRNRQDLLLTNFQRFAETLGFKTQSVTFR